MSASSIAEFQSYRFVRDRNNALAEIPLDRKGERQFLVLDCPRFRLARLHIFEGLAADDSEAGQRFEPEMEAIRQLGHPSLTPILSSGRDDTELFIADALVNGEALGRYLRRTGPMGESHALDTILDLLDLLTCRPALPRTLANFDTGRLHVTTDPQRPNRLRLHFNDFTGWTQSVLPAPADLAARVSVALYSLLAGFVFRFPPFSPFQREASHTSPELQNMLLPMLAEGGHEGGFPNLLSLRAALMAHRERRRATGMDADAAPPAEPREFLRDWLLEGAGPVDPGAAFRILGPDPTSGGYAFDAVSAKGSAAHGKVRFQLFPNWESIPRDGWLEQHQAALRRPGRSLPNQLTVVAVEPWGRCLLIGEERVEGVTLDSVIRQFGRLDLSHAREIASKVNAALDAMEKTAVAAPVWSLVPRNVYLVTGNENSGLLRQAVERHGTAAWQRLPVRLRLHQTARDLAEGLTFPESIMKRIRGGGKAGERGRRAVALLPLLGEMLDGVPFSWDRPFVAGERLPAAAARVLEQTRLRLLEDPKNVQSWLLDDLNRALESPEVKGKSSRETHAVSVVDGLVSAPESLFDGLEDPAPAGGAVSATLVAPRNRSAGFSFPGLELKPLGQSTVTVADEAPTVAIEVAAEKAEAIVDESLREPEADAVTTALAPAKKHSLFGGWFGSQAPQPKREAQPAVAEVAAEPEPEPAMVAAEPIENDSAPKPDPEPEAEAVAGVEESAAEPLPVMPEKNESRFRRWLSLGARESTTAALAPEPQPETVAEAALPEAETGAEPPIEPDSPSAEPAPIPEPEAKAPRRHFSFRSPSREAAALLPAVTLEIQSQKDQAAPAPEPELWVKSPVSTVPLPSITALAAVENPFEAPAPVSAAGPAPEAAAALANPFDAPVVAPTLAEAPRAEIPEPEPVAESQPEPVAETPEPQAEPAPALLPPAPSPVQPALVPAIYPKKPSAVPGEPLSFFAFLKTESQQTQPAQEPSAADLIAPETAASLASPGAESGLPAPARKPSHEPIDLPSIGRLFASSHTDNGDLKAATDAATTVRPETKRRLFARIFRAATILAGCALALWGITFGLVAIAGSVERETLAETFPPVVHTDYLKLAQQAPFPPALPPDDPLPAATGSAATVAKASEAIALGEEARQSGRFGDAMNLYLRAIELEPASSEARTQLSAAMEAWTGAENEPVSASGGDGSGSVERSAEHAPKATWLLADYYLERDRSLGLRWLRKSAESGHARHQRLLGITLSPVPESQAEALDWFRRAAESGDAESQLLYGVCLLRGRGTALDARKGADWVEKAAQAGDARAMDLIGVCHASGLGRDTDPAAALLWFQRACDAGNSRARYNLAVRYAKGLGAPADKPRAAREFRAGADEGDADAMHGLGRCLEAGFGLSRDLQGAADWMRRSAALGHHEALAWCLRQGIAVEVAVAKH